MQSNSNDNRIILTVAGVVLATLMAYKCVEKITHHTAWASEVPAIRGKG